MKPKQEEVVPGNQPPEFRCLQIISVLPDNGAEGVYDGQSLEEGMNDLFDEADSTKRQVISLNLHTTPLNEEKVLYTIHAQWAGVEYLRDVARRNALAAGMNGQPGPRGIV